MVGETSGQASDFALRFTDAATGRPVTGLQPYLGAAGHVVILRADGTRFAHAHAETTDARGRPSFATPGSTFGPDLDLHTRFETAGTYRLWGQFRLADGTVITTAFTVHPHPATTTPGHRDRGRALMNQPVTQVPEHTGVTTNKTPEADVVHGVLPSRGSRSSRSARCRWSRPPTVSACGRRARLGRPRPGHSTGPPGDPSTLTGARP